MNTKSPRFFYLNFPSNRGRVEEGYEENIENWGGGFNKGKRFAGYFK